MLSNKFMHQRFSALTFQTIEVGIWKEFLEIIFLCSSRDQNQATAVSELNPSSGLKVLHLSVNQFLPPQSGFLMVPTSAVVRTE